MSYQNDRDHFIATVTAAGLPVHVAREIMRHAATIDRCAVLACSSEAADRDRVPCPGRKGIQLPDDSCLCRDYGTYDGKHGDVPRYAIRDARAEAAIVKLLPAGFRATFGGDPRGYCVKLHLPSGAWNTWGGAEAGYGVPVRS